VTLNGARIADPDFRFYAHPTTGVKGIIAYLAADSLPKGRNTLVVQQALEVTLLISAPLLLAALITGLVISVFQAATQINEMTLSFIPKLLAVFAALVLAGPWMLSVIVDFTRRLFSAIPGLIG